MDTDEHGSEINADHRPTVRLQSQTEADCVRLERKERLGKILPTPGDLRFEVNVRSLGFTGHYDQVWVDDKEFQRFLGDLRELELTRSGNVTLAAMSPDEFELHIQVTDCAGHMIASGFLGRRHWTGHGEYRTSRVSFSLALDPSRLRELLEQFTAMNNATPD